jgi:large subunit ribosomal protein L13
MNEQHPEKVVELAVKRMLPKNKLGRNVLGHLKIYKGTEHPHGAQQPKELKLAVKEFPICDLQFAIENRSS